MNKKLSFVVSCPVDTYSGYGARARDLVKAIYNLGKYDLKVMPQRWGSTPWGYIDDHAEEWGFLKDIMLPFGQPLTEQPDIWMQITIPNEFQPIGKFNIGATAGIETTLCHPTWIEGLNRMNLNLVSSKHAKDVFVNTQVQKRDQFGNLDPNIIKVQKPIEVLFEGADLNVYFEKADADLEATSLVEALDAIPESFSYLFVGHWINGDFGEDRKNVPFMIKAFLETFKNQHNAPALILKTSITSTSKMGKEEILKRIDAIKRTVRAKTMPNVYVLLGDIADSDINDLYNHPKVKAMISFTKGEGFGRPLLEFSLSGKPIIASGWSGQLDFLNAEFVTLIGGQLKPIHPSAMVENILIQDSLWFAPNEVECGQALRNVYKDYKKYAEKAKRQKHYAKTNFSFEAMQSKLDSILEANVGNMPRQATLQLPKLQLPKLQKI